MRSNRLFKRKSKRAISLVLTLFLSLTFLVPTPLIASAATTSTAATSNSYPMYITSWGGFGSGMFSTPCGLNTDSAGNVYVIDNNVIKKLDSNGTLITQWGEPDWNSYPGYSIGTYPFNPKAIAVDQANNILATDMANGRILKFDSTGKFITYWTLSGFDPGGIAVDKSGNVYVADNINDSIVKLNSDGSLLYRINTGYNSRPSNVAVDSAGYIYIDNNINIYYATIEKYSPEGQKITSWGTAENIRYVTGLTVDPLGYVYVTATEKVYKYGSNGSLITTFGEKALVTNSSDTASGGKFTNIRGLAADQSGNLYISDSGNLRIQKYDVGLFTPTNAGLLINSGANATVNQNVELTITAEDPGGISQMILGNDPLFSGSNWEGIAGTKNWTLPGNDGVKTVYVKFKNNDGEESLVYSASIKLDGTAPTGFLTINNGVTAVNTDSVTLNINATDNSEVAEMLIGNDPGFTGSTWETYNSTKAWFLTPGDGKKDVYIKYKDIYGNESTTYHAAVLLDTNAPQGSFAINNGEPVTYSSNVNITLNATDPDPSSGIEMMISENFDFSGAVWEDYNTDKVWILSPGDGSKIINVKFRDKAGNESGVYANTISLDSRGSISGTVNGQDGGLADVDVSLLDYFGNYVGYTTTDSSGNFSFTGLPQDAYKIYFDPSTYNSYSRITYQSEYYDNQTEVAYANIINVSAGSNNNINVQLNPTGSLEGNVVDEQGTALGNIQVTAYDQFGNEAGSAITDSLGNYTIKGLPQGSYTVEFKNSNNEEEADANSYLTQWYNNQTSYYSADWVYVTAGQALPLIQARMQLQGNGSVSGKVTTPGGLGISDVTVNIFDTNYNYIDSAITDLDGNYVISGLRTGSYKVSFQPLPGNPYLMQWYNGKTDFNTADVVYVNEGVATPVVNAQLKAGASISGNVSNSFGGLAGAAVYAYEENSYMYAGIDYTDANGNYTISFLKPGKYKIYFAQVGSYSAEWYNDKTDYLYADTVTVAEGTDVMGINALLERGGSVSGQLTNQYGEPLSGVNVTAYNQYYQYAGYAFTDINGNYTINGLLPGAYRLQFNNNNNNYNFYNNSSDWYDNKQEFYLATPVYVQEGQNTIANSVITEKGSILGRVTDGNGMGIAGVSINIFGENGEYAGFATTDWAGNYSVALDPGTYWMRFEGKGYLEQWYNGKTMYFADPLVVLPGESINALDTQLSLGGSISGTVQNPEGRAVSDVDITLIGPDGHFVANTTTNISGSYYVSGLETGLYTIQFNTSITNDHNSTEYVSQTIEGTNVTENQTTPLNVQLNRGGTISGIVNNHNGIVLPGISVVVFDLEDNYIEATQTDQNGFYKVKGLDTGRYKVAFYPGSNLNEEWEGPVEEWENPAPAPSIDTSNYLMEWYNNKPDFVTSEPVSVTINQNTPDINATLEEAGTITGTVTDTFGQPLSGVMVTVYDENGNSLSIPEAFTDIDGHYSIKGLYPANYKIKFLSPYSLGYQQIWYNNTGNSDLADAVTVASGQVVTGIDARLTSGIGIGSISGNVTDQYNLPVAGVMVTAYGLDGQSVGAAHTDYMGNYTITNIEPGSYQIKFSRDYYYNKAVSSFHSEWYNNTDAAQATTINLAENQILTGINAKLELGGSIIGNVFDYDFSPVPGVNVNIYDANGYLVSSDFTNLTGYYCINGLANGTYKVLFDPSQTNIFEQNNYQLQWFGETGDIDTAYEITINQGEVVDNISVILEQGQSISGFVKDTLGYPVPYSVVEVYDAYYNQVGISATDYTGAYVVTGLRPGSYKVKFNNPYNAFYDSQWYQGHDFDTAQPVEITANGFAGSVNATLKTSMLNGPVTTLSVNADDTAVQNGWYTSPTSINLGTDRAAVTLYSWDNPAPASWNTYKGILQAPEGAHTLYYFSAANGTQESAKSREFKVDTNAPSGTMVINDNRITTNSVNVTLKITANDISGADKMLISNNAEFKDAQWENYSATKAWKLESAPGSHTVYVKLMDKAGNISTVISDDIRLVGLPMKLWVDTPVNGGTVKGSVNVSGWALSSFEMSAIEVHTANSVNNVTNINLPRLDVSSIYGEYANSSNAGFAYALDTTKLPNGLQTITVIAKGADGQSVYQTIWINVNNPPMVMWLDTPGYGSTIRGTANVSGWAVNVAGIESVTVHTAAGIYNVTQTVKRTDVQSIFGTNYANTENSGFIYPLDTTKLPNGSQTIQVVVKGKNGEIASKTIWVNVDNAERLWLDSPAYGSKVTGPVKVSGWALSSKGLESVKVQTAAGEYDVTDKALPRIDVAYLFPGYDNSANSGFSYTLDTTNLPNGWQTITVVAKGINGKSIYKTIWINVDNTGKLWLDTPYYGSTVKGAVTVSGWALSSKGLASVKVHTAAGVYDVTDKARPRADVAGLFPGYANSANSGYYYTLDTTKLPNGWQTISIVSTGNNGEVIAKTIWINVDNPPTILWMDTPAYGSTISGKTLVSGWAVNVAGISSIKVDTAAGTFDVTEKALDRADVGGLFGTKYANSYNSGFAYNLDTTKLPNGLQTITLIVTGMNMDKVYRTIWVNVKN